MNAVILRFNQSGEPRVATAEDVGQRVLCCSFSHLEVPIEEPRFCSKCLSEQRFIVDRDCAYGLIGTCMGCGDEYFRPFSRTTTEAAS